MLNTFTILSDTLRSIRRKNKPFSPSEPGPGVKRAAERLRAIRLANASIPMDEVFTRQQRRQRQRSDDKLALSRRKELAMRNKWIGGAAAVRLEHLA